MSMDGTSPASSDSPRRKDARIGWLLVTFQIFLLGMLGLELMRARDAVSPRGAAGLGGVIAGAAVMGLASRRLGRELRAHPAPSSTAVLRVDGPYRVVRHPIYAGLLLFGAGLAAIGFTARAVAAFGALAALLSFKARFEERLLAERFPAYREYARRTPRFVPRLSRPRDRG